MRIRPDTSTTTNAAGQVRHQPVIEMLVPAWPRARRWTVGEGIFVNRDAALGEAMRVYDLVVSQLESSLEAGEINGEKIT